MTGFNFPFYIQICISDPAITNRFLELGNRVSEPEVVKLKDMYCHARSLENFALVLAKWFRAMEGQSQRGLRSPAVLREIQTFFRSVEEHCWNRIQKLIPNKSHLCQLLEEEQEKELENEVEEEKERCLPARAEPGTHKISDGLSQSLVGGELYISVNEIHPISHVFKNTSVQEFVEFESWGQFVFCTGDFIQVVKRDSSQDTGTQFLRPVTWTVRILSKGKPALIVISPFEANQLLSEFRKGIFKASLHLFSPRTTPDQNILIDNPRLWVPSSEADVYERPPLLLWHQLLPPLFLCSGNLYFVNELEQEAFSSFLCLVPRPRTEKFQKLFELGQLSSRNGFLAPEYRTMKGCPVPLSGFKQNPEKLVNEISLIRHQLHFPEDSHVARIVLTGVKVEKFNKF